MGSTLPSAIAVGRLIDGRFPLLEQLGGTDWSAAYKTELDYDPRRKAAVKVFAFESVDPRVTLARWDVARTLSHPHLMPLLHAGRCEVDGEDLLYVVTEYAEETLSQVLPERPLTLDEGRQMLGPVLEALSYLHKLGLTHGHLRPTNMMVVGDHLKLSPDFGWRARARSIYDPPEVSTTAPAPAADIWSLGILLVECFTQQPPDWDKLVGDQPEALDAVPEPFFTIARECLQIDPARRCTIADIKAHLNPPPVEEPVAERVELPPAKPVAKSISEREEKRSYKSLAFIVMCLALALFFLVAAFRLGWDLTPATPAPVVTEQTVAPLQTPAPAAADAQAEPIAAEPADEQPSEQATDSAAAQAPAENVAAPAAPVAFAAPIAAPAVETASTPKPPVAAKSSASGVMKAAVAQQVLPNIPAKIIGAVRGHVNVGIRVEVDAAGNVSQASIESQGPSRYFADQALKAAQSWKFMPAQVDGRAAASTWLVQFQFGNSEITASESEQTP